MKLKTSFFNTTVLRKDVTRFAPLWGLYTVFMLMVVMLIWADENEPARFAANAADIMQTMGVVNCFYGGLCALLLFGDLFQSKMAGSLHAMPMRREGWFLTHSAAGFLFCLVPNSIGAVLASMILQEYCYLAFIWLGLMLLQFLFFFGIGAFSTQCAGNKLGAVAVYGLFNLLAVLVAFLVETFYTPVLYGIETDWEAICRHSPVVNFSLCRYVDVSYNNMNGSASWLGFSPADWQYLWVAAAVGFALLGASVLLYRRRHLESAGDFIAVKPVAPIFLVIYTLCAGAVLYFFADQLNTDLEYPFLLLGFAIGMFTGFMLLEKKVNVFQGKKWLAFGVLTLVFFLTVAITALDPLGITRYVPKTTQIEKIYVSPFASEYYLDRNPLILTDAADMEAFTAIHQNLITERNEDEADTCLRLRYYLKSGTTVERKYYIHANSEIGKILKPYFSRFSCVTGYKTVEQMLQNISFLEFYSNDENVLPCISMQPSLSSSLVITDASGNEMFEEDLIKFEPQEDHLNLGLDPVILKGLLEAIEADCKAGNMAQNWDFHPDTSSAGNMTIGFTSDRYITEYVDITVFSDCQNTIDYLTSLAISQQQSPDAEPSA